jgi:hypothetical protein
LVKSLIKLRNWSTIHGLYSFLDQKLKKNYTWILVACKEAKGQLENACREYKCLINASYDRTGDMVANNNQTFDKISLNSNYLTQFLNGRINDCYFQLHDWKEFLAWNDDYKHLMQHSAYDSTSDELKTLLENKIDLNYIR